MLDIQAGATTPEQKHKKKKKKKDKGTSRPRSRSRNRRRKKRRSSTSESSRQRSGEHHLGKVHGEDYPEQTNPINEFFDAEDDATLADNLQRFIEHW